jgi:hypothetical protein
MGVNFMGPSAYCKAPMNKVLQFITRSTDRRHNRLKVVAVLGSLTPLPFLHISRTKWNIREGRNTCRILIGKPQDKRLLQGP